MSELRKRFECSCHDPFHFIYMWFDSEWGDGLEISFRVWNGRLWKRIIAAVRLIFDGWESSVANWTSVGKDNIREIRDFLDECLKESE